MSTHVSLNGQLNHEQRVEILVPRIRAWRKQGGYSHLYTHLVSCGEFDDETSTRILELREHPNIPLTELGELKPIALALKEAFRIACRLD